MHQPPDFDEPHPDSGEPPPNSGEPGSPLPLTSTMLRPRPRCAGVRDVLAQPLCAGVHSASVRRLPQALAPTRRRALRRRRAVEASLAGRSSRSVAPMTRGRAPPQAARLRATDRASTGAFAGDHVAPVPCQLLLLATSGRPSSCSACSSPSPSLPSPPAQAMPGVPRGFRPRRRTAGLPRCRRLRLWAIRAPGGA